MSEGHCTSDSQSHVCGVNGKTYPSLCYLHKAEIQLAYSGMCRPHLCKNNVCGRDGVTYPSSCHARAQGVRVDYPGDCFAERWGVKQHGITTSYRKCEYDSYILYCWSPTVIARYTLLLLNVQPLRNMCMIVHVVYSRMLSDKLTGHSKSTFDPTSYSHYPVLHGCSDVVKSGRCPKLTCPDPVLPKDNCCPVCG